MALLIRLLWIIASLLVLSLVIYLISLPDPIKLGSEQFLQALSSNSYEEAFSLLSDTAQQNYGSPEQFQAKMKLLQFHPKKWYFFKRDTNDLRYHAVDGEAVLLDGTRVNIRITFEKKEKKIESFGFH